MSLVRRQIRKQAIVQGLSVQSHVDGSISFFTQDVEAVSTFLNELGYEARQIPAKLANSICFASPETVEQGRRGQHFYRGPGEFALTGDRAEAYRMQELHAEALAENAARGAQVIEPENTEVVETASQRRNRRRRERRAAREHCYGERYIYNDL